MLNMDEKTIRREKCYSISTHVTTIKGDKIEELCDYTKDDAIMIRMNNDSTKLVVLWILLLGPYCLLSGRNYKLSGKEELH